MDGRSCQATDESVSYIMWLVRRVENNHITEIPDPIVFYSLGLQNFYGATMSIRGHLLSRIPILSDSADADTKLSRRRIVLNLYRKYFAAWN